MEKISLEKELVTLQSDMRNYALSLTFDVHTAEDLLQDTALKVLDNQDKYVEDSNFKGWVMTIMKNTFINNYRKAIRTQTVVDSSIDLANLDISHNTVYGNPESSSHVSEIVKAVYEFSDDLRIPLIMRIHGYKFEEIAKQLMLPVGTVKSRIFLARKRLQEKFKDYK
ncbi:MAG: RNA polymerase sigma factor [Paludibacter sp.]|jgi:RNA polymerase sigma-70 factor (ECF subfamily)|nr:RNA polymerase sigma factor [Paludibacter sp.]